MESMGANDAFNKLLKKYIREERLGAEYYTIFKLLS